MLLSACGLACALGFGPGTERSPDSAVSIPVPHVEPQVRVRLIGPPGHRATLRPTVEELLGRLVDTPTFEATEQLDLVSILRRPATPSTAIEVWIDLRPAQWISVIVRGPGHDTLLVELVRHSVPGQLDEVAREEVGYIVHAGVEALLAGDVIGVSREDAAEQLGVEFIHVAPPDVPLPEVPPPTTHRASTPLADGPAPPIVRAPPPPAPAISTLVTLDYRATAWLPGQLPTMGAALGLQLRLPRPLAPFGGLTAGWAGGSPIDLSGIAVDTWTAEVRLMAGMAPPLTDEVSTARRWRAELALGGGLDVVRSRSRATAQNAVASAPSTSVLPVLTARLGPALSLLAGADRLVLHAGATLDVTVTPLNYSVTGGDAIAPWRIRPGAYIGIGWLRRHNHPTTN